MINYFKNKAADEYEAKLAELQDREGWIKKRADVLFKDYIHVCRECHGTGKIIFTGYRRGKKTE